MNTTIQRSKKGSLKADEKRIIKGLLKRGWRNQDIQALVNIGRDGTINSARITEVKRNNSQRASSDAEVDTFIRKKRAFDPQTGLNLFYDERLIRSREAMILAVQTFNSAGLNFKSGVFAVLANIAWTYLLHEYYHRKGVSIVKKDGWSLLLGEMLKRHDCPLSDGVRNNLEAIKKLRDDVEHIMLGDHDARWNALFQACCVNFDKSICELFGQQLTLSHNLSVALQFAKMDVSQLAYLNQADIPPHIEAIDARLTEGMTEAELNDLEYRFRVVYTIDAASKSKAHFAFIRPESAEGKEIHNILVQHKPLDEMYPHKPSVVCNIVSDGLGSKFTSHNHTQAWRYYQVRPKSKSKNPENTDRDYCIYHAAHRDYTYSEKWVEFLISEFSDPQKAQKIKEMKIN